MFLVNSSPSRRLSFGLIPLTALAATLVAPLDSELLADVAINDYVSNVIFHHRRVGVPDYDQRRDEVAGDGNCFCAPTSMMNLLGYVGNHGYAAVEPGPGFYTLSDAEYGEITVRLIVLASDASISPGGPDLNDPDCDGGFKNGDCSSLPCGGSNDDVYNSIIDFGWLNSAEDDLIWTARFLDDNAPAASFATFAQLATQGNIVNVAYGRYSQVGVDPSTGLGIWKRGGGHVVSMNEIFSQASTRWMRVRDPAQDEGDLLVQSPYASKEYTITNVTINVTKDVDVLLNWTEKTLAAINEPHDDGKKRLLDSYIAVRPKSGVFWKDYNFISNLPLTVGFGSGGGVLPAGTVYPGIPWEIRDLVLDEHALGWYVLTGGSEVAPPQLVHIDPFDATNTVLGAVNAHQIALGRLSDIYALSTASPVLRRFNLEGQPMGVVTLPSPASDLVCDDDGERVLVLRQATSGFGGTVMDYPRTLGTAASLAVPTGLLLGAAPHMAVNPVDRRIWVAAKGGTTAFGLKRPSGVGGNLTLVESIAGFTQLNSLEFDDSGALYAVDGATVKKFVRTSSGAWSGGIDPAFAGVDASEGLRLSRSRTNFVAGTHDTEAWNNLDADELALELVGVTIPDCIGDLNGDGVVDGADLGILLAMWNEDGIADFDGDGLINGADLGTLLAAWGECVE